MENPIRIELPEILNMKTVNSWLFKNPEPTLVDCGELTPESWESLQTALANNGLSVKDIRKIVITHAHVDHMGMANRIVQESGAMVHLSEYAFPWAQELEQLWDVRSVLIRNTFQSLLSKDSPIIEFFGAGSTGFGSMLDMWEVIPAENTIQFLSQDGIEIGDRHWEVIYAPGHSSTQTVFFDPTSRHMLSADMLLQLAPTPVIELDPDKPGERQKGLPKLIESFHKMKSLDIKKAYPGHYTAFEHVNEVIDAQLTRIEMRLTQCLGFVKEGTDNFSALFAALYPKRIHFPALVMMIGYLDELEERGLIRKDMTEEGTYRFSAR